MFFFTVTRLACCIYGLEEVAEDNVYSLEME
jgi:hypothetical protein